MNWLKKLFGSSDKKESTPLLVVAKVLTAEPHPNADRLRLARLFGGQKEVFPVVCGAKNLAAGQKVALAKAGYEVKNSHHGDGKGFVLEDGYRAFVSSTTSSKSCI